MKAPSDHHTGAVAALVSKPLKWKQRGNRHAGIRSVPLERQATSPQMAGMNLHWKRPLFYCLLPIFIFLAFVGFPPPFAPPLATKPGQEQSERIEKKKRDAA